MLDHRSHFRPYSPGSPVLCISTVIAMNESGRCCYPAGCRTVPSLTRGAAKAQTRSILSRHTGHSGTHDPESMTFQSISLRKEILA